MTTAARANGQFPVGLGGETASDGNVIVAADLPQAIVRNADTTVNYIEVTTVANGDQVPAGTKYRQTFTWVNGDCTNISNWVKQ